MEKIHINFSSGESWDYKQKINSETAISVAGFDQSITYNVNDIDIDFYEKNIKIFNQGRGFGYWLWKPYLIYKTMENMNDNDILFYSDTGAIFVKNLDYLFDKIIQDEKGVILFQLNNNFKNKNVTKRDCFYFMGCDDEYYHNSIMFLASFILIKKNNFSQNFISEWLNYCEDYRILTDSPNECGLPNFETFEDHRHDQSILSILGYKYKVSFEIDPSQYGNDRRSPENQLINHTR
jgi:hypothetical protein